MNTQELVVALELINGQPTTTSLDVATRFGKLHKDVMRAIRGLGCSPEFYERNFAPIQIDVDLGMGRSRKDQAFRMTRDGFTFLCMGFTGPGAAKWKEAYINAFNAMEQALTENKSNYLVAEHGQYERHLCYFRGQRVEFLVGNGQVWGKASHIASALRLKASDRLTRSQPESQVLRRQIGMQRHLYITPEVAGRAGDYCKDLDLARAWSLWVAATLAGLQQPGMRPGPLRLAVDWPVERLAELNPHAYGGGALRQYGADPSIHMPLNALCGMDSRSPTLQLLADLESAGGVVEACRLEVVAMRHHLESYLRTCHEMKSMWESLRLSGITYKLTPTAQQLRAQGVPGY